MFNKNFYPTPKELIKKMVKKVDFGKNKIILEPSAGKGDIAKYILDEGYNMEVDCIEIEPQLQAILKNEDLPVVFNDFLKFFSFKKYDAIIMNPPFDDGEKHLLKAIDLMSHGGEIICLLNAETLKNPYSVYRKDLKIKLENLKANIEYIDNAFAEAERKTSVEVALIHIKIEKVNNFEKSDILNNLKKEKEERKAKEFEYKEVVNSSNYITMAIEKFNYEVEAGVRIIEEVYRLAPLFKSNFKKKDSCLTYELMKVKINDRHYSNVNQAISEFLQAVRYKYWEELFQSDKFDKLFTSNLQNEYMNELHNLRQCDFNDYNINMVMKNISGKMVQSVENTIFGLFEELSQKYHWSEEFDENIHYYNGWASNSAYKINKKVIIPLHCINNWRNEFEFSYSVKHKLSDIEKVLNYLDINNIESLDINEILFWADRAGFSKNIELKHFKVSFYKKGTCHITFKDDNLLLKFNIFGSQKKGWLPPSYGQKRYSDMSDSEKTVIDEFQGKESYEEVYDNQEYFISNVNNIFQLENNSTK